MAQRAFRQRSTSLDLREEQSHLIEGASERERIVRRNVATMYMRGERTKRIAALIEQPLELVEAIVAALPRAQ